MGQVIHFPPRLRLISAEASAYQSLERNKDRASKGDDIARICLETISRYPGDTKIAQTAVKCLQELKRMGIPTLSDSSYEVQAPSDVPELTA